MRDKEIEYKLVQIYNKNKEKGSRLDNAIAEIKEEYNAMYDSDMLHIDGYLRGLNFALTQLEGKTK
jgi:hypothetical protein